MGLAVGSLEASDRAAAPGSAGRGNPDAVGLGVAGALFDDLQRRHVDLDVGRLGAGADPGEAARLGEVRGEGPGLRGPELLQRRRLERVQEALRLGRGVDAVGGGVVAEVLADRGLVSSSSTSRIARCSAGPTPESISSFGEL